jgi:hypothetical protein
MGWRTFQSSKCSNRYSIPIGTTAAGYLVNDIERDKHRLSKMIRCVRPNPALPTLCAGCFFRLLGDRFRLARYEASFSFGSFGENIVKALSTVIDFYDISPIIGFFMMDNATSNDVCIQELAEQYPTIQHKNRLHCVSHMLKFIVKALLCGKGVSKLEKQLRTASNDERFKI